METSSAEYVDIVDCFLRNHIVVKLDTRTQNYLWIGFLGLYSVQKYLADVGDEFNLGYLVNVGILVSLTAIIPYYLSRLLVNRLAGSVRLVIGAVAPLLTSGLGLTAFFFIFIRPYVPDLSVIDIIPRAILPGVVMGLIIVVPLIGGFVTGPQRKAISEGNDNY